RRRALEERALHLEGADAVAGRDDDGVGAPDEPEVAVLVAAGAIAGEIPLAAPARRRLLRALPVFAEERRRLAPQRELAHLAGRQLPPVLAGHAQVVAREGLPHRARPDREAGRVRGEGDRPGRPEAVWDQEPQAVGPAVDHPGVGRLAAAGP